MNREKKGSRIPAIVIGGPSAGFEGSRGKGTEKQGSKAQRHKGTEGQNIEVRSTMYGFSNQKP